MLKELIENKEKYYWTLNSDGDIKLGNSDLGLKAIVTFTATKKWANMAPLVEETPGKFIGKPETFSKGSENFQQIIDLEKVIKEYLKTEPKINRDKVSRNTLNLLHKYYKKKN
ncbi:MAG: hypothetical protein ACEPOZ_00920 [Marinifilaceae bacterium]